MSYARIAIYLVGLALLVAAVWVFLTQTEIGQSVPAGFALAIILLIVGVGVMASARGIRESREYTRVVHDAAPPVAPGRTVEYDRDGTYVEERRRYD